MTAPLSRDYRVIGCAVCRRRDEPLIYHLPPPWGSLDARDDVRLHPECYRRLVWLVWAALGFGIPPTFLP